MSTANRKGWLCLEAISWCLNLTGKYAGEAALVCMVIIIGVGVVARYIFNSPIKFTEDVSMALMIPLTFLPLAFVMKERAHISVDIVFRRLPSKYQNMLSLISQFLVIAYCFILLANAFKVMQEMVKVGKVYFSVDLPYAVPMGCLLAGVCFMLLAVVISTATDIKNKISRGG
ncbi:hypothetical protein ES703_07816 [subsurface metagenome]